MADSPAPPAPPPTRRQIMRRLPMLLALLAILGGGGFHVAYSGLLADWLARRPGGDGGGDIAFVPLEPLVVNLAVPGRSRHLRIAATIETTRAHHHEVARLLPRILDVMNGYLQALEPTRIEEEGALVRIRQHLLRRLQMITGAGQVSDLLITEFVIN